jgi:hypothetical protein
VALSIGDGKGNAWNLPQDLLGMGGSREAETGGLENPDGGRHVSKKLLLTYGGNDNLGKRLWGSGGGFLRGGHRLVGISKGKGGQKRRTRDKGTGNFHKNQKTRKLGWT